MGNNESSILTEQPSQIFQKFPARSQAQKTELLTVYLNNGGVEDMVQSQNNQEVINVSKTTKDDEIEFDVTVSLYSRPDDRFFF